MSLEIEATLICDGCGSRVSSEKEYRFTLAAQCAYRLRHKLERGGWLTISRGKYHTQAHYCSACKDKPAPPIKRRARKPIIKRPPTIIISDKDNKEGEEWKTQ